MALGQRRMVYTNLWQNAEFSTLPDKAKLLYIGLITVADDDGRLRANSLLLRSQIFPLDETITQEDVRKWLNLIVRANLIEVYRENNEYFVQHPKWDKHQQIRKDLYKSSKLPPNPLRLRNEAVTKKYPKLSKVKLSKDKRESASLEYFKKLPQEDIDYFLKRFQISEKLLKSKAEDLLLYCNSHGRQYRNYRAFMLNSLKKDFQERKPVDPPKVLQPEHERTPEEQKHISELLKKTREKIMGKQL